MTADGLTPLLAEYTYVLLDLDGCVYVGDDAIPGAVEAVAALRAAGKGVAFVTNDGRRSGEEYVRKLWGLGLQAVAGGGRHGRRRDPARPGRDRPLADAPT